MEFTNEMIAKAKEAGSARELMEMAKAEGIALSEADAEQYFGFLHGSEELSDDELSMVAGGKGSSDPDPKYKVGQRVKVYFSSTLNYVTGEILEIKSYRDAEKQLCFKYHIMAEEFGYPIWLELDNYAGGEVTILN